MTPTAATRYSNVAILLHWLTALAIFAMIPMGLWMSDAITHPAQQQLAYRLFQLHKSIGFTILALSLVRFAWRLGHAVPALPAKMPAWERFAAHATHAAFYALLVLIPLTGWIYVSAGWSVNYDQPLNVATSWFGLAQVPHLPFVADAAQAARRITAFRSMSAHSVLAWGMVALIALHVLAALKHQYIDKDRILAGMATWLKTDEPGPAAPRGNSLPLLAGCASVLALAVIGGLAAHPGTYRGETETVEKAAPRPAATSEDVVPGTAAAWTIDAGTSEITFDGEHAGNAFHGRFNDWHGQIWFDPQDLAGSKAAIFVETGSARTGDATQEGSLAEEEWFSPTMFPVARFDTTRFRSRGGNRYEAVGTLRVKRQIVPVRFPFTLSVVGRTAHVQGRLTLDRIALDLGKVSDPTAQWVSQNIDVAITLDATRR